VTYSLQKHAESRGLQSVMVEVRNDLIDTAIKAEQVADHLTQTLEAAMKRASQEGAA
jgi:predicted N-formylglutamate amidohydrolase